MNKHVFPVILFCSSLLFLCSFSASAQEADEDVLLSIVGEYIEFSNQRVHDKLLAMYVPKPTIIRDGKTMEGSFESNLRKDIEEWTSSDARFELESVGSFEAKNNKGFVEFSLKASGRTWGVRLSKIYSKRLDMIKKDGSWLIIKDTTN